MQLETRSPKFFYISSRGGSATAWLSMSLSKHPQVVAFHGSQAVPSYAKGGSHHHVHPREVFAHLIECSQMTSGMKYFGAVHLYHGAKAYSATTELGGIFSAIIRDPIKRINSLIWHYAQDRLSKRGGSLNKDISAKDVFTFMEIMPESAFDCGEIKQVEPLVYAYEDEAQARNRQGKGSIYFLKEQLLSPLRNIKYGSMEAVREFMRADTVESDLDVAKSLVMDFVHIASHTIMFDLECHRVTHTGNRMFKMEEMVKSQNYFRDTVWPAVAPHLECSDEYLKDVFSSGKTNQHSLKNISSDETFKSWPRGFQDAFQRIIMILGHVEVEAMYENYDYKIPRSS